MISACENWPEPKRSEEQTFHMWRIELLHKYATAPEQELTNRLGQLQASLPADMWNKKYQIGLSGILPAHKQAICEAGILEYLLGLYPVKRRRVV